MQVSGTSGRPSTKTFDNYPDPRRAGHQEPPYARYSPTREPTALRDARLSDRPSDLTWDPGPGASSYWFNVVPVHSRCDSRQFICDWGATTGGRWLVSTPRRRGPRLASGSTANPPLTPSSAFRRTRPALSRPRHDLCARVQARSGRVISLARAGSTATGPTSATTAPGRRSRSRPTRTAAPAHPLATPATSAPTTISCRSAARPSAPTRCFIWNPIDRQAAPTGCIVAKDPSFSDVIDYALHAHSRVCAAPGRHAEDLRRRDDDVLLGRASGDGFDWQTALPAIRLPRRPVRTSSSNRLHRRWSPPMRARASRSADVPLERRPSARRIITSRSRPSRRSPLPSTTSRRPRPSTPP